MSNKSTNSGISFLGMLTILFIALKLTNYIAWSWWLVLSPLWIPTGIVIAILSIIWIPAGIAIIIALIIGIVARIKDL
jgi:hypothetical protein